MKINLIPTKKLAMLSAAVCAAMLAFSPNARALTIGDDHELGTIVPGTAGDADRTALVDFLRQMALNSDATFLGEALHRSGNDFGPLPAPVIGPQGNTTTINLGAVGTFTYLFAKYDADNAGAEVWYVGDLGGIITIPADWNGYGLSGWTLFGPGTTPPGVPDGGATVMLLGGALGALGMARRYLKR
jgi:VPDSG-CTERM motif